MMRRANSLLQAVRQQLRRLPLDRPSFRRVPVRPIILSMTLAAALLVAAGSQAQTAATVTATCKDGTAFSSDTRKGACRGHGGVQTWGQGAAASAKGSPSSATPSNAPAITATGAAAAPAAPAAAPAPVAAKPVPAAPAPKPAPAQTAVAPGGGAGQVWANTTSKVYHCPNDKYYGKTKVGAYMSESDAKAKGYRPDRGKACS